MSDQTTSKTAEVSRVDSQTTGYADFVTVYGDGIHDDTHAIQKISNGEAYGVYPDGSHFPVPCTVALISGALVFKA